MSIILLILFTIRFANAEKEDYEGESFIGKKWHENKPDSLIVIDPAGDAQEALDSAKDGSFKEAMSARTCIPACDNTECQEITYVADTFVYPTRGDFLNAVNKMDYCRNNNYKTEHIGPPEFNWVPQDTQKETTEHENLKLGEIRCGKCRRCWKRLDLDSPVNSNNYYYYDRETLGDRAVRLFRLASLHYYDDPTSFISAWNLVASYGKIYQVLPESNTCESYGFNTIPERECHPMDLTEYNAPFEWFINVSPGEANYVKCGKKYYNIFNIQSDGYISLSTLNKPDFDQWGGKNQLCQVSAEDIPSLLPYGKSWENRIALGTIANAQLAAIAWARAQCNSYESGSCLLGIHENSREDGLSMSVPVLNLVDVDLAQYEYKKDGYNLVIRQNSAFLKETQESAKMVSVGITVSLEKGDDGKISSGFGSIKKKLKKKFASRKNKKKARKAYKSFFQKAKDKVKDVAKKAKKIKNDVRRKIKKDGVKQTVKQFVVAHKEEIKDFAKEKAVEKGEEFKEQAIDAAIDKGNEYLDIYIGGVYGEEAVEDRYLLQNDYEQMKEGDRDEQKQWLADELTHAIMEPISVEYWFEFGSCVGRCDTVGNYDWAGVSASITAFDSMDASASYYNIVQSAIVPNTGDERVDDAINLVLSLAFPVRAFSNLIQGATHGKWTRHLFLATANFAIPNPVALAAAKAEDGTQGILDMIQMSLKYNAGNSRAIESDVSLAVTQIDTASATNIYLLRQNNTMRNIMQPYLIPFTASVLEIYKSGGPSDRMGAAASDIVCPKGAFVSSMNPYECFQCPINTFLEARACKPRVNLDAVSAPMPLKLSLFFEPDIVYGAVGMKPIESMIIELEENFPYAVDQKSVFRAPSLRNHIVPVSKIRDITKDTPHMHGAGINPLHHIKHKDLVSFNWFDTNEDNTIVVNEDLNFNRVPVKTCDFFGLSTIELHSAYQYKNSKFLAHLVEYLQDMDASLTQKNVLQRLLKKQCGDVYEPAYIPAGISYSNDLIKYNDRWHSKINDNSNNPNRRFGLIPVREPECSYKWKCICGPNSTFRYTTYGEIKNTPLKSNELLVPVTSMRECKAALRFWGDSGLVQYDVENEWTSKIHTNDVEKLPVYQSSSKIYGCFKHSGGFSFNTNIGSESSALDCKDDQNVVKVVEFDLRFAVVAGLNETDHIYLVDNGNIKHKMLSKGVEIAGKSFVGSLVHIPNKTEIRSYRTLGEESYFIDHVTTARYIHNQLFIVHHKTGESDSPFILQTDKATLKFHMGRTRHVRTGAPKITKYMTSVSESTAAALQHAGDLFTPGIPDENGNLQKYMVAFDQFRSFDTPSNDFDHLVQVPAYDLFTPNRQKYARVHNMFMKKMSCMNKLGTADATVYVKSVTEKTSQHISDGSCDVGYVGKHCDVPVMSIYESIDIQLPDIMGQLSGGYCGDVYSHTPLNGESCENRPVYASHHCKEGMGMITVTHLDQNTVYWTDTNGVPNTYIHNKKKYHQCAICPEGTSSPEGGYICRQQQHTYCDMDYFAANPTETSCNHRCMPGWYGKECTTKLYESTNRIESHYSSFVDKYYDIIDDIPHPETSDWGDHAQRPHRTPVLHAKKGISYADNEILTQPKFLTCNSGFVPSRLSTAELDINMRQSPVEFTTELQRISARYANTCGGYKCIRCPETYFEQNQVCVPCPLVRQVAGWALGETGDLSNTCLTVDVPKGHFYDALKPACKHDPFIWVNTLQQAVLGNNAYDTYILKDLYEDPGTDAIFEQLCTQTAWAGVCLHNNGVDDQSVCENTAVEMPHSHAKYTSSCEDWAHRPLGGLGGYQASVNQTYCDIAQKGRRHDIIGRVVFKNGLSGSKPNVDWTAEVNCEDYEICNGNEVVGCQPGYIWFRDTNDPLDNECRICNNNTAIAGMHPEKDAYEYCDGSPYIKCARYATHTDADPATFGTDPQGVRDYIGSRPSWNGSTTERFEVNYANYELNINKYTQHLPAYYKKIREYDTAHDPLNSHKGCYPTPDGFYTLPDDRWEAQACEDQIKHMCVHRTSHKPLPGMESTLDVTKYPNSNAVMYQSFDVIYRFEPDLVCLPGRLPNGCSKEPCVREGQSNCWCGDDELFCTLGCVNDVCRGTCGNEVCHPYNEVCYGFNDISSGVSFASCEHLCTSPTSTSCVIGVQGLYRYCAYYTEDYNKPPLSFNNYDSPCLDEVPDIAETQCISPTDQGCFCGRHFIATGDSVHWGCFNRILEPKCTILQDDGTCTYVDSPHGKCICGDVLTSDTCYSDKESKCSVHGTHIPSCMRKIQENIAGACRVTVLNQPLPEHDETTATQYSLEQECDTYISHAECEQVANLYNIPFITDSNRLYSEGCNYNSGSVYYNSFDTSYVSQEISVACPYGSYTPGVGGTSEWHVTMHTNALWREEECKDVFERFELPFRQIITVGVGNRSKTAGYRYDGCQEDGTIIQFNMNDRRAGLGTKMCVFNSPYIVVDDATTYKSICKAHDYTFENPHLCAHKDSIMETSVVFYDINETPRRTATCTCENCADTGGLAGCMDKNAMNFDIYASVPSKCIY